MYGRLLGPPRGTTPAAVTILANKIKLRSFKSSEHINEKGDGPYHGFGYLSLFSDPINLATWDLSVEGLPSRVTGLFLIFAYLYLFISEFLWLCRVAALKSLSVHSFNALIFPILRDCLQSVCIPMGTNCALLVADFFLYCYERDFMDSLNHDNQADVIEAFNSTSRYLDDLLNIDNPYFESMVNQIYPPELQLNKANISDTEAPFLDLHLSVANGFVFF